MRLTSLFYNLTHFFTFSELYSELGKHLLFEQNHTGQLAVCNAMQRENHFAASAACCIYSWGANLQTQRYVEFQGSS